MTPDIALPLLGLALLDSTSIGTLLVPLWLLTAPGKVRGARLVIYLLTIASFYWIIGVGLLSGFSALGKHITEAVNSQWGYWVQLIIGIFLFVLSFRFSPKKQQRKGPGRLTQWRNRIASGETRGSAVVGLALGAGVLEVATMLPYLGAIGILSASTLSWGTSIISLVIYCVVMITPALVLLLGRITLGSILEPKLAAFQQWMSKNTASATAWMLGIGGFLIARDAIWRLGFFN